MARKLSSAVLLLGMSALACSTRHWAEVKSVEGPPPPGQRALHTGRLFVSLDRSISEIQCVRTDRYRPVCFHNLRSSLEAALSKNFWSSFPETIIGSEKDATERDYVLEVHFAFETLPPGDGPGWSTGAKAHYRLLRASQVLHEETLASRSRADYAYGAPLGEGASDTLDAIAQHIVLRVSQVPELEPDAPRPLPAVATRPIVTTTAAAKAPSLHKSAPQVEARLATR